MLPSQMRCYTQTIAFVIMCEIVVAYSFEVAPQVVTLPHVVMMCTEYLLLRGVAALQYECATLPSLPRWMCC